MMRLERAPVPSYTNPSSAPSIFMTELHGVDELQYDLLYSGLDWPKNGLNQLTAGKGLIVVGII